VNRTTRWGLLLASAAISSMAACMPAERTGGSAGEPGAGGQNAVGGSAGSGASTSGSSGGGGASSCSPSQSPCDLFPQCGCAAGVACDVVTDDGTTGCFASTGVDVGAPCSSPGSCKPGLTCYLMSTCKRLCKENGDCSSTPGSSCLSVVTDNGASLVPNLKYCTDQCDLVAPGSRCGPGAGCWPLDDLGVSPGHSACYKAGASTDSCSTKPNECAAGWFCANKTCYKFCRPGVPTDCPGTICRSLSGGNYYHVGTTAFGLCN
jgi:hypothetical protein